MTSAVHTLSQIDEPRIAPTARERLQKFVQRIGER